MRDTIIFDVGNVLHRVENDFVRKDIARTLKISLKKTESAWYSLIPNTLGIGKISESEFWKRFIKLTGSPVKKVPGNLLYRELQKRFSPHEEVMHIVRNLKTNGYKLGIISDTIKRHADVSKKRKIFDPFDVVLLSYQTGYRKTNPEIFNLALKKLNSKPENSVFVDDVESYTDTAAKLGITGITFNDVEGLKTDLRNLGINFSSVPENEETTIGSHALLVTQDNKIVLQQRSSEPHIDNPGMVTMFGGTIRKNETVENGLIREIFEEVDLKIKKGQIEKLGIYHKTKRVDGVDYTIHVSIIRNIKRKDLNLKEGVGFVVGIPQKLLKNRKLTRITRLALEDYTKLNKKKVKPA